MKVWTGDPRGWGPTPPGGTALTIGVFDGVHKGHQAVLGALSERADAAGDLGTVVVTFDAHPRAVLAPARAPKMLATVARRLEIFDELGIDYVGVLPFDRIRNLPAEEFVRRVVVDGLDARTVIVGRGFRYGTGRTGDVASLRAAGEAWGFAVEARPVLEGSHGPISSSFIRRCIADGDVATTGRLLGRLHELPALVTERAPEVFGHGLPTTRLEVDRSMAIPGQGLYAGWIATGDETLPALCDIGTRTGGGPRELIRVHILDPDRKLGSREVAVRFAERLSDQPLADARHEWTGRSDRAVARARRLLGPTGP